MRLRFDVVGLGANSLDEILAVPSLPAAGGKAAWTHRELAPGGAAAVTCVVCRRFGYAVSYAGPVGDDEIGAWRSGRLAADGLDLEKLRYLPATASQRSWVLVTPGGVSTALVVRPEGLRYPEQAVDGGWIARGRILHLDGSDPLAAARAAELARAAGVTVSLQMEAEASERLLCAADHLIGSRRLWADDPRPDLLALRRRCGIQVIAATLGSEGVLALGPEGWVYEPGYAVEVLDSTGADAVFQGGYLVGLLSGWDLRRRLRFASALAALNRAAWGAQGRIATLAEVHGFQRHARRLSHPASAAWM